MPRKRVAVYSEERLIEHITHPEAFQAVAKQMAVWDGPGYKAIRLLNKVIVPRGKNTTHFDDVWELKDSGGIAVWQARSGSFEGLL